MKLDQGIASIIVALIAALGSVIGILIGKTKKEIQSTRSETETLRKENREDHQVVAGLLRQVIDDVHEVDKKLDNHIESHNEDS